MSPLAAPARLSLVPQAGPAGLLCDEARRAAPGQVAFAGGVGGSRSTIPSNRTGSHGVDKLPAQFRIRYLPVFSLIAQAACVVLAIGFDCSMSAGLVVTVLDQLKRGYPLPDQFHIDHGAEYQSARLVACAGAQGLLPFFR